MTNALKSDNLTVHSGILTTGELYRSILKEYPDVLNVDQVSTILGISDKMTYKLLNGGDLKSLKIGRMFKIPKIYLLQYIKVID